MVMLAVHEYPKTFLNIILSFRRLDFPPNSNEVYSVMWRFRIP
jgi:hypothetical protein